MHKLIAATALALAATLTLTACSDVDRRRDCTVTRTTDLGDRQEVKTRECGTVYANPGTMFLMGQMYQMSLNNQGRDRYVDSYHRTTPQQARQRAEKARQAEQRRSTTKTGTGSAYKAPAPAYRAPAPAPAYRAPAPAVRVR